jgi:hypothetical protein
MFQTLHRQSQLEQDITFRSMEPDIVRQPGGYLYLPNIDPDVFQRFCDFLYQDALPNVTPSWVVELKLYKLADLLGAHALMNRLVDSVRAYHLQTDTHFSIHQVRSIIQWGLGGSGIWNYCVMGMAYQLACGLYAANDYSFDKLCEDCPDVSDAVVLEVKKHVKDFHANLDYRQRDLESGQGFGQCKFHVHHPGNYCLPDDFNPNYPSEGQMRNTIFLGRYPVESPVSLESEEGDRILQTSVRRRKESGAGQRRRQRMAATRVTKPVFKARRIRRARV